MRKIRRFFAEGGVLGVGGTILAFALWITAFVEKIRDKGILAVSLLLGGCAFFCFGAFMAWAKADDRADLLKPKLGFSADSQGFYLTHLEGETARFIEINPLVKKASKSELYFDPLDFLGSKEKHCLSVRLKVGDADRSPSDGVKAVNVMFRWSKEPVVTYPITVKFRWNSDSLEEKLTISWIEAEQRFQTKFADSE